LIHRTSQYLCDLAVLDLRRPGVLVKELSLAIGHGAKERLSEKEMEFLTIMADESGSPIKLKIKESAYNEFRHRLKDPLLAEVDTVILEEIILKDILKMTSEDIQHHRYIEYHRDIDGFWEALRTGSQVGWIMNYPDANILFEIGGRGLRLPQKSTYFFPKLPTGMVFRELEE